MRPTPILLLAALTATLSVAPPAAAPAAAQRSEGSWAPLIEVDAVFGDGFETGSAGQWTATEPPGRMDCDCYFSFDCPGDQICDYGPGGLTVEDICNFVERKPDGLPGYGCDLLHEGPWAAGVCDGVCRPSRAGSLLADEEPGLLEIGIQRWTEALLGPAATGSPGVDEGAAAEARGLAFRHPESAELLGRYVADLLILTSASGLYHQYCAFEAGKPPPVPAVDLTRDPCRIEAGRLATDALCEELYQPGAGSALIELIPLFCPAWQGQFAPHCPSGPGALSCLQGRVSDLAAHLAGR